MAVCYNRYTRQQYYCRSRWSSWGRWVALVVILVAAFILFFMLACISQRRRRKQGAKPFYGTGWTYKLPGGGNGQQYNPQYNNQAPPSQYGQQNQGYNQGAPPGGYYAGNTGSTGANQSYFGGRDAEMQAPQNVYNNNNSGYAPPSGPPPNKYQ